MSEPGAELRTFLIADVRGYTRFTQDHGDEAGAAVAARFAELARTAITQHGGQLVELRGDEALGVFASARAALRAAVELQTLCRTRTNDEPGLPLGVGIGLDAGEAVLVERGFRGGALNLAARLCSLAAPGEILASETVVSLARRVEGLRFVTRGPVRLKGLDKAVRAIEVVPEEPLPPVPQQPRGESLRRFRQRYVTGRTGIAGAIVLVAVAGVVVALLSRHSSERASARPTRVGLVLEVEPKPGEQANVYAPLAVGLDRAKREHDLETQTMVAFKKSTDFLRPDPRDVARVRQQLRNGHFDLVIWAGIDPFVGELLPEIRKEKGTRFVFVDAHLFGQFARLPNLTALAFRGDQAGYLAGYLGGLMEKRRPAAPGRPRTVSVIGGIKHVPAVQELVGGFVEGAHQALPNVKVRVDYSNDFLHESVCERIANRQIDAGSGVIFPASGVCGLGALSAAGIRGVWGVGVDQDRSYLGDHILASVVKRFDRAAELTVTMYLDDKLPPAKDLRIGVEQDAVGLVGVGPQVPEDVRAKVAREAESLRDREP